METAVIPPSAACGGSSPQGGAFLGPGRSHGAAIEAVAKINIPHFAALASSTCSSSSLSVRMRMFSMSRVSASRSSAAMNSS